MRRFLFLVIAIPLLLMVSACGGGEDDLTTDSNPPITTADPLGGNYYSSQTVTLSCNKQGATIYYTTNGTVPTTSSTEYASPIVVGLPTTLKFFCVDSHGNQEDVKTVKYFSLHP